MINEGIITGLDVAKLLGMEQLYMDSKNRKKELDGIKEEFNNIFSRISKRN